MASKGWRRPWRPRGSGTCDKNVSKFPAGAAEIPYETEEGIADFHAAGRHTHITELLRNGATLAETRELARHTDVRQTMKYTHIGVQDQARAVQNIPTDGLREDSGHAVDPKGSPPRSKKSWEYPGSKPRDANGQSVSSIDNRQLGHQKTKPLSETEVIAKKHQLSSVVKSGGGGNRTRVPWHLHASIYVCSRQI